MCLGSWFMPQNFLCPQRDQPLLLNTQRRAYQRASDVALRDAAEAWRRIAALDTVLEQIASVRYGQRVYICCRVARWEPTCGPARPMGTIGF